ncbi:hypothetical protein [Clostridium sp. C8-1-8]|uniref:hypothetical protein n=1 Tax=Clostridium sp. C8-1-8 TaxID=2698831 RepID=UPI00136C138B|nr:hypothetical protein [Clostridium sp. C8-1-8]
MNIIGLLMITLVLIITLLLLSNQIRNIKKRKHYSKRTYILTLSVISFVYIALLGYGIYAKKGLFFVMCILIELVLIICLFIRGMGVSKQ